MHYIVLDLEFNQELSSLTITSDKVSVCPFEIIQIGAIKLNTANNAVATFNSFVKPSIYLRVSDFVTELTGITTQLLLDKKEFPNVLEDFLQFMGDECILCTWGMTDMKELYRNALFHSFDMKRLPNKVINLQPYVSIYLKQPAKKLLNLQTAVDALKISKSYPFHNALYDAYYTAHIFKKMSAPELLPEQYIPNFSRTRTARQKQVVDYEGLHQQFVKMYRRELTTEEQNMITLAYKMGRTNQFVTQSDPKY